MPVVAGTGVRIAPGDVLFTSAAEADMPLSKADHSTTAEAEEEAMAGGESEVIPGEGCVVQYVEISPESSAGERSATGPSRVRRCIVATRQGVAQWDGRLVSVFAAVTPSSIASAAYQASPGQPVGYNGLPAGISSALGTAVRSAVLGPRPGDTVHLRVTRLNRLFAFGEIIAVNWRWCSHRSATAAAGNISGIFKGVLRVEDIRPFRPTKDQLQPPAPTLAFALGDVVLAEVISQSDAHQYQLSTIGDTFGVVESHTSATEEPHGSSEKLKLQHIPGRRDAMLVPSTGGVVPRWCPLLP
jgi:exosome complex component CSL4